MNKRGNIARDVGITRKNLKMVSNLVGLKNLRNQLDFKTVKKGQSYKSVKKEVALSQWLDSASEKAKNTVVKSNSGPKKIVDWAKTNIDIKLGSSVKKIQNGNQIIQDAIIDKASEMYKILDGQDLSNSREMDNQYES